MEHRISWSTSRIKILNHGIIRAYVGIDFFFNCRLQYVQVSELLSLLLFCIQHGLLLSLLFGFESNLIRFLFHPSHLVNEKKKTNLSQFCLFLYL